MRNHPVAYRPVAPQSVSRHALYCWLRRSLFVLALIAAAPAHAQNTFNALSGEWLGAGTVDTRSGSHERVKCKANYVTRNSGQGVQLTLTCASDAYKFELSSDIVQDGAQISGLWFESTHRVGGKLSGTNNDGLIEARAEGDTFTALLTVGTNGNRQSFLMESPGAQVSQVTIDLQRGGELPHPAPAKPPAARSSAKTPAARTP